MTQDELRARLDYDRETGVFRWLDCRSPGGVNGSVAGWHSGKNAWRISIDGEQYLAHRLAWFYVHGEWPAQIDHINGDRRDNRFCNLRPATNSQNQANNRAKRNNRLGIRGIGRDGRGFRVQLRKGREHVNRYFGNLEDAKAFAKAESARLHGEYSVHERDTRGFIFVDPSTKIAGAK